MRLIPMLDQLRKGLQLYELPKIMKIHQDLCQPLFVTGEDNKVHSCLNHSNARPEFVVSLEKSLYILGLTVPWEVAIGEAYEWKSQKYTELAAEAELYGWHTQVFPAEVGCGEFLVILTTRLLKDVGIRSKKVQILHRDCNNTS